MNSLSDPVTTTATDRKDSTTIKSPQTGFRNTRLYRILKAIPLILLALLCNYTMGTILQSTYPFLNEASSSLELELDDNVTVHLRSSFYGIPWLDKLIKGIGIIAPLYYFIHYVSGPLETTPPSPSTISDSPIDIHEAKALFPAVLIGYYIPTVVQKLPMVSLSVRQIFCGYWQLYPIWLSIVHHGLSLWYSAAARTTDIKRLQSGRSSSDNDMVHVRRAYLITGSISAAVYFYVRFLSGIPTCDVFIRGMFHSPAAVAAAVTSVTDGMVPAMKYDAFFTFVSGLLWISLTFGDLKAEGVLRFGTVRVVSVMLLVVYFFGPGAATAFCWGWREEILHVAKRRLMV
ncbi:hypothetical protein C8Q69DRAFT_512657 [Paecilomyces variotii]|uniref:Uncharacterized protein n=1 Tax=Byssochlamys spectabilis TaxID=264951 RepID=A0A443I769_BYSSP|nr:hypothetical protein C8Q69DRAFT_512657 [Paecilomyces variotii]RWQ99943.1 hypothetical protein C8Q69DRAFT_512657 [Paecilomyces variotii]